MSRSQWQHKQFPSAIRNEQASCISYSLIPLLWTLHSKKVLKNCWRLLLCYMICQDKNAAMLLSAWSKILDKATVLVAVTVTLKSLCWLVWHHTLSLSYFCLQQQGLISLVGKSGSFGFVVFSLSGKYKFTPQLLLTMVFSTLETLRFPGRAP